MKFIRYSVYLVTCLLYSCAVQVAPEGGPADKEPPKIVSSSPENFSTNFSGSDIEIEFDEYIALNEINAQLVISPLLKTLPEIKIRKRTLVIHFNDTLLPNTTYTMNFGLGLMDNNEGNKLENYQYVFSTGPVIDSLEISGNIKNSFNRLAAKNDLVMLYRLNEDSIPYLKRPLYFARTNDSGDFKINNISPDNYKIIGLRETDGDYIYSGSVEEQIAFSDSLISSGSENVNLDLFNEIPQVKLLRAFSEYPGKAVLVFNTAADSVKFTWITSKDSLKFYRMDFSQMKDTVSIWYKSRSTDSLQLFLENTLNKDTIILRLFQLSNKSSSGGRGGNTAALSPANAQSSVQHLHLPYNFHISRPAVSFNADSVFLKEDSLPVEKLLVTTDSINFEIRPLNGWKQKTKYQLYVPPGVINDIFDTKNDSILSSFITRSESDYGSVKITFENGNSDRIILQLTDEARSLVFREAIISSDTIIDFTSLSPATYRIKLIYDANENGKWDTGNYLKHIQPENTFFYPTGVLIRANWDVELTLEN